MTSPDFNIFHIVSLTFILSLTRIHRAGNLQHLYESITCKIRRKESSTKPLLSAKDRPILLLISTPLFVWFSASGAPGRKSAMSSAKWSSGKALYTVPAVGCWPLNSREGSKGGDSSLLECVGRVTYSKPSCSVRLALMSEWGKMLVEIHCCLNEERAMPVQGSLELDRVGLGWWVAEWAGSVSLRVWVTSETSLSLL